MLGFSQFNFLSTQFLVSQPNCEKAASAFPRRGCWSIYCPVRTNVSDNAFLSRDLSSFLLFPIYQMLDKSLLEMQAFNFNLVYAALSSHFSPL